MNKNTTAERKADIKLRDLLKLGIPQDAYLVHETVDVGFISTNHLEMLTDKCKQDYETLLNAPIAKIQDGAYGAEIVLTDIEPQIMMDFDQAAADHIRAEHQMGDFSM